MAHAGQSIKVPLTADRWQVTANGGGGPKPDVQFTRHEGFPQGVLVVKSGSAVLQSQKFRDGTIEFDLKGIGEDIPGIQFRQQGAPGRQNAEEFYVCTLPDCRASNDCIQYAPVINGFLLWNAYPQYQAEAFILDGWNHIKLVVAGRRMNVYINRSTAPALMVGNLESSSAEGAIELHGPANFANLVISPDATEGLPAQPTPDPDANDAGLVRHWRLGPLTPAHYGRAPSYSELPTSAAGWQSVDAGRFGLVNLNRNFASSQAPVALSWLCYSVSSDRDQTKHVSLGWLGEVWVFVNGKLITQGKNFYDPESERRDPDGRLSLENGSFNIPLQKGNNEVVLAIFAAIHDKPQTGNRYGWGAAMRYDDPGGLRLSR